MAVARRHAMTHPTLGPVTWAELKRYVRALRKAESRKACWWCFGAVPKWLRTNCGSPSCGESIRFLCYWPDLRVSVIHDQDSMCQLCGLIQAGGDLEVDHIIPVIEGGLGDKGNLRALCIPCHKAQTRALAARRAAARRAA